MIPKKSNDDNEIAITGSCGCFGCLITLALFLVLLGLGILAVKYAWTFLVWAWNYTVTF